MAAKLLVALAIGYLHHPPIGAHAAVGLARVHRPNLVTPAVARIACLDRGEREQPAAAEKPASGSAIRARRVARWLRQKRLGIYIALASSMALGGTRPTFAASRSAVPPDLEQAFRRERFTPERLKDLGVDVNKILTKKFLFAEHQMSEVQKEINDYESAINDADSNRATELALFMGVSAVGAKLAMGGAKKIEKWMKDRDAAEIQREIEMTGTYVNPFAGDVEEIVDPITGAKKKLEKKPQAKKSDDPGALPTSAPPPPTDGPKPDAGVSTAEEETNESNLDVLDELL